MISESHSTAVGSSNADEGKHTSAGHADAALQYIQGEPEIVFAIATGTEHLADRAAGVIDTWCSQIHACVFFSDGGNPSGHPVVYPLSVAGERDDSDSYVLAQMRYLPILENMRIWLASNKLGKFGKTKWVVLADDDTFVFYHNLKTTLATLDHTQPIYTGEIIPDEWLPTHFDGSGNDLGVFCDTPFAMGGGGSIFSAAGLLSMEQIHECVINQRPGGRWDRWQSDWMIGQCAYEAGINATRMTRGTYNQFVCTDEEHHVHYCADHGGKVADGELVEPATIHPVKDIETMKLLREDYPMSDVMPTRDVVVEVARGEMRVLRRAEAEARHAAKRHSHGSKP